MPASSFRKAGTRWKSFEIPAWVLGFAGIQVYSVLIGKFQPKRSPRSGASLWLAWTSSAAIAPATISRGRGGRGSGFLTWSWLAFLAGRARFLARRWAAFLTGRTRLFAWRWAALLTGGRCIFPWRWAFYWPVFISRSVPGWRWALFTLDFPRAVRGSLARTIQRALLARGLPGWVHGPLDGMGITTGVQVSGPIGTFIDLRPIRDSRGSSGSGTAIVHRVGSVRGA